MALFGKKKTQEEQNKMKEEMSSTSSNDDSFEVKVLGSGCAKCNQLEVATKSALEELGIQSNILHVTDFTQIAAYGVMTTPALVINNKVVSYGKVLKKDEAVELIKKEIG